MNKKHHFIIALIASSLASSAVPAFSQFYVPPVGPGRCINCPDEEEETVYPEPRYREERQPEPRQPRRDPIKEEARRFHGVGMDHWNRGDFFEAYRYFKYALEHDPRSARYRQDLIDAMDQMGAKALRAKENQTAREWFEQVLEYMPRDRILKEHLGLALHNLAWEKWRNEDFSEAWEMMQRAGDLNRRRADLQEGVAQMRREVENIEEAYDHIHKAYKRARKGDFKNAVYYAREAVTLRPRDPALRQSLVGLLSGLGTQHFEAGEYQEAANFYTEALNNNLNDPIAQQNYALIVNHAGVIHFQNGDYAQAIASFELATQWDGKYAQNIALAQEEMRKEMEGQNKITRANETAPSHIDLPETMPLSPEGFKRSLEGAAIADLDSAELDGLEEWLDNRDSERFIALKKSVAKVRAGKRSKIDWDVPAVMGILVEQGMLGEYYNEQVGGIEEREAVARFRKSVALSIEQVLAEGRRSGKDKVFSDMQARLRDYAQSTVQTLDEWVLTNETTIKAMERDILPVVKVLAPVTRAARGSILTATIVLNLAGKRAQGEELSKETIARVLGREVVLDIGQDWLEKAAVKYGVVVGKTKEEARLKAKNFAETVMNYYDTEQWEKER